jgi:hypothetical protein
MIILIHSWCNHQAELSVIFPDRCMSLYPAIQSLAHFRPLRMVHLSATLLKQSLLDTRRLIRQYNGQVVRADRDIIMQIIYPTIGKYSEVQQKKVLVVTVYTIWRQIELVMVAFVILGLEV